MISSDQGEFLIELYSSFCNAWPKIEIIINDQLLWSDFVVDSQTLLLKFKKQQLNNIKISYLNKRNGPDVYDTIIDQHGNILYDQHCIIKNIFIDQAKISFLINDLEFHALSTGKISNTGGWMTQRGSFNIVFPMDIYDWIINLRNTRNKDVIAKKRPISSLSYYTSYLGDNNNKDTEETIARITNLIENME
jgi:hypothetical protein